MMWRVMMWRGVSWCVVVCRVVLCCAVRCSDVLWRAVLCPGVLWRGVTSSLSRLLLRQLNFAWILPVYADNLPTSIGSEILRPILANSDK